jgi:hypothetical protein
MPGFDKTGPMGDGPMTGRRMGRCTNYGQGLKKSNRESAGGQDDIMSGEFPRAGRGFGWRRGGIGRGFGLGRQNRFRGGC